MPVCTDTVGPHIVLHVAFVRKRFSIMHVHAQSILLQAELIDMYCYMPFADDDIFLRDT